LSGSIPKEHKRRYVFALDQKFLDGLTDPKELPAWLSEQDLDYYAKEYARTGFRGRLELVSRPGHFLGKRHRSSSGASCLSQRFTLPVK
jgi:hypothetical protein